MMHKLSLLTTGKRCRLIPTPHREYPWLLMNIFESPHCKDPTAVQDTLVELLTNLQNFALLQSTFESDLFKYQIFNFVVILFY